MEDHLSDEKLLLFADGEVGCGEESRIREHLSACRSCRLRMQELDGRIAEVRVLGRSALPPIPPPERSRAWLKTGLRELAADGTPPGVRMSPNRLIAMAASIAAIAVGFSITWLGMNSSERAAIPRSDLTPGAVRAVALKDVCAVQLSGNSDVLPIVQRQVFAEYGMPNAETRAYEVDYLITPALGGADDIRNLWPQPYSGSAWNAYVKDALEDHLRRMVCTGQLDLSTAQHEIASNWVAAYKKYFHTRRPLPQHQRLRRDGGDE